MALIEPLETRLFVGRRGVQSLIKWMLVNPAVWGPKVTKYHVLLKGFRKSKCLGNAIGGNAFCWREQFGCGKPVLWATGPVPP